MPGDANRFESVAPSLVLSLCCPGACKNSTAREPQRLSGVIPVQEERRAPELCLFERCPAPKGVRPAPTALPGGGQPFPLHEPNFEISKSVWLSLLKITLQEICVHTRGLQASPCPFPFGVFWGFPSCFSDPAAASPQGLRCGQGCGARRQHSSAWSPGSFQNIPSRAATSRGRATGTFG